MRVNKLQQKCYMSVNYYLVIAFIDLLLHNFHVFFPCVLYVERCYLGGPTLGDVPKSLAVNTGKEQNFC